MASKPALPAHLIYFTQTIRTIRKELLHLLPELCLPLFTADKLAKLLSKPIPLSVHQIPTPPELKDTVQQCSLPLPVHQISPPSHQNNTISRVML